MLEVIGDIFQSKIVKDALNRGYALTIERVSLTGEQLLKITVSDSNYRSSSLISFKDLEHSLRPEEMVECAYNTMADNITELKNAMEGMFNDIR